MEKHSSHIVCHGGIYLGGLKGCISLHRGGEAYELDRALEESLLLSYSYGQIVYRGHDPDLQRGAVSGSAL